MAGSLWGAAVLIRMVRGGRPGGSRILQSLAVARLEFVAGAATALFSAGAAPFILAAASSSGPSGEATQAAGVSEVIRNLVRLAYRLVAHPASSVYSIGLVALFAGVALLAAVAVIRVAALRRPDVQGSSGRQVAEQGDVRAEDWALLGLIVAAMFGVAAPTAATFVVHTFETLRPSYSTWLFPVVFAILGAGVATVGSRWRRRAAVVAVLLAILGSCVGTGTLLRHRVLYSHGPSEWISELVDSSPQPVAVIYDGSDPAWGFVYFPLVYQYGDAIQHWLIDREGRIERIRVGGTEPVERTTQAYPWSGSTELWVRASMLDSAELKEYALQEDPSPISSTEGKGGFGPTEERKTFTSFVRAEVGVVNANR